jgi:hypothetical protein
VDFRFVADSLLALPEIDIEFPLVDLYAGIYLRL